MVAGDLEAICERAGSDLREFEGQRVLITGGGGFLGHYLVRSMLEWNLAGATHPIEVVVADNWIRGVPRWLEETRAEDALRVATLDVTKPWPSDVEVGQWVIHAASIASPTFYREHPIETMDANVEGLRGLLSRVTSPGSDCRGLLFFSSSEVYGDPPPEAVPTPESYNGNVSFTGPRACYDESKRYGETLCANYARVHDTPVTVARPFNNYGPGLPIDDRRVIPDFARDILSGRDVELLSSGGPTRTFCYVADAIVGYLAVLVRGRSGEAYNVGADGPQVSMRELADRMVAIAASEFGYEGSVTYARSDDPDYLVDNPDRRCPDITKARTELGFSPSVELDEGLRRTLHWYRDSFDPSGAQR